jgi:hypothetical protein
MCIYKVNNNIEMKNTKSFVIYSLLIGFVTASCYPNGDKNSTDANKSYNEGAIDTSRLATSDTVNAPIDSNAASFR